MNLLDLPDDILEIINKKLEELIEEDENIKDNQIIDYLITEADIYATSELNDIILKDIKDELEVFAEKHPKFHFIGVYNVWELPRNILRYIYEKVNCKTI